MLDINIFYPDQLFISIYNTGQRVEYGTYFHQGRSHGGAMPPQISIWTQCLETGPILEGPVPHLMGLVPNFRTSPISVIYKGFLNNMVKLGTGFYFSSKYEHYMDEFGTGPMVF